MMDQENTGTPPAYSEKVGSDTPIGVNPPQTEYTAQPVVQPYPGGGAYQPPPGGGAYQYPQGAYQTPPGGAYPQHYNTTQGPEKSGAYPPQPSAVVYTQHPTYVMTNQPVAIATVAQTARVPDYLIPSILACMCCFWPTGAFAIIYAMKASNMAGLGNVTEAHSASKTARNLMITSVIIGCLFIVFMIILYY